MGLTSGTNRLETGWKTRSKLPSAKAERSRMSHWMVSRSNSSRSATNLSCASCLGELSSTVTLAPATAKVGACWPPPEARHRTSAPHLGKPRSRDRFCLREQDLPLSPAGGLDHLGADGEGPRVAVLDLPVPGPAVVLRHVHLVACQF